MATASPALPTVSIRDIHRRFFGASHRDLRTTFNPDPVLQAEFFQLGQHISNRMAVVTDIDEQHMLEALYTFLSTHHAPFVFDLHSHDSDADNGRDTDSEDEYYLVSATRELLAKLPTPPFFEGVKLTIEPLFEVTYAENSPAPWCLLLHLDFEKTGDQMTFTVFDRPESYNITHHARVSAHAQYYLAAAIYMFATDQLLQLRRTLGRNSISL